MSIFSQRYRSSNKSAARGFTLIELLVVMSIMVIVTGVLLVRQSKFDSSTLMRSLAYSVALSVRQAQVYGVSVFGTTTSSGVVFAKGYGIYVGWGSGNPTSYTLFADLDNNGTYTDNTEIVKVFSLGQGYSISNLCATTSGANPAQYCPGSGLMTLSILYRRPNPEACITTSINSTDCGSGGTHQYYATSLIQLQANGADAGSTRSIFINTTGQISVGNVGT